jgi:hypothetical protein
MTEYNQDIYAVVSQILQVDCPARQALLQDIPGLCTCLHMAAPEAVFDWSFKVVQEKLCSEVVELSAESNGLHFTIEGATSQYLEGSFMQTAAKAMMEKAPSVWKIVTSLLDANPDSRRMRAYATSDALQWPSSTEEGDLYDIGGAGETVQCSKRERRAAARNAALLVTVCIASPRRVSIGH